MAVERICALNHSHAYQTPLITWKSLQNQMGSNYTETRNFVTKSKQSLNHVVALWNVALADADANSGLHYSIEKGGVRLRRDERQRKDRHSWATQESVGPISQVQHWRQPV